MRKEIIIARTSLFFLLVGLLLLMVLLALSEPYKEVLTCQNKQCVVKSYYLRNYCDTNYFNRVNYGRVDRHYNRGRGKYSVSYTTYTVYMGDSQIFQTSYRSSAAAEAALAKIESHYDIEITKINWYQNIIKNLTGWAYLTVEKK